MGTDEAGSLSRLNALRRELIDPAIAAHSGRIVRPGIGHGDKSLSLGFQAFEGQWNSDVTGASNALPQPRGMIRFQSEVHGLSVGCPRCVLQCKRPI
jgi:hypothetical protein